MIREIALAAIGVPVVLLGIAVLFSFLANRSNSKPGDEPPFDARKSIGFGDHE